MREDRGLPVAPLLVFCFVGLAVFYVVEHICKLGDFHDRIEFLTIHTLLLPFVATPVNDESGNNIPWRAVAKAAGLWCSMVMLVGWLQIFGGDPLHSDSILYVPFDLLYITLFFLWVVRPAYEGIHRRIMKRSRP